MSYLEVFGALRGVRVDVSKFFGVGAVLSQNQERSLKNVTSFISDSRSTVSLGLITR